MKILILIIFHVSYFSVRRTDGHEMGRNSKAQLFLSTLWYTTVSLTILLLTMYLFLLDLKTSTKYTGKQIVVFFRIDCQSIIPQ